MADEFIGDDDVVFAFGIVALEFPVADAVAVLLEEFRVSGCGGVEPVGHTARSVRVVIGEMAVDAVVGGEASGHDCGAAWGADAGTDVELGEEGAFGGEAIEAGGFDVRVAVAAEITPAPVVSEDEDNIRGQSWASAGRRP